MKTLVLITSNFPFGTSETFLASEFPFLTGSFEKVIIIAQNVTDEKTRTTPGNVTIHRYNPATTPAGFLYLPVLFILNSGQIIKMLREEIEFRLSSKGELTIGNFLLLFKRIFKVFQLKEFIVEKLETEGISESIIFYSYWLKTSAQAIALLQYRKSIKISRGHGSDIYEEKTGSGYLPLLKFSALNLDAIFFASKQGKQYFENKTKTDNKNLIVSYLGSNRMEIEKTVPLKSDKYIVVSCSNMIPLKRIDLIIKSLSVTQTVKDILWLHFGDGVLRNELETLAEEFLGKRDKISFRFMGYYNNEDLLKYYCENHIDLFINTSSTEGIPVSIMEAQSFGIPVIATDTGGVGEIVTEGTGSLLSPDFSPFDLAHLIMHYEALDEITINEIRRNAFNNWNVNFNAPGNYTDFIIKLNSIFASSKELKQ